MNFKYHITTLLFIFILAVSYSHSVLANNDDSVDGSCVDDDGTSSSNTNTNEMGLFPSMKFLREAVFGQRDADYSYPFLTMLEDDDDDRT